MPDAPVLRISRMPTPIGELCLVVDAAGVLRSVDWTDHEPRLLRWLRQRHGPAATLRDGPAPPVADAFRAYFDGEVASLDRVPVTLGGTPFQAEVWAALRTIPAGRTVSYAGLARLIGRASAVRAVGLANGANPLSLIVPCHRVIGTDGTLTGYGGGLERKRWLLAHEGAPGAVQASLL